MPLPSSPADDTPIRLPYIHAHEQQPDLVERVAAGLRDHSRVVMGALTDRDQQRIIAAGKVAGKRLKRAVLTTVTNEGVLVEFDDSDDPFGHASDSARTGRWSVDPSARLRFERDGEESPPPTPRFDPSRLNPSGQRPERVQEPEEPQRPVPHEASLPRRVPGAGPKPGERPPRRG